MLCLKSFQVPRTNVLRNHREAPARASDDPTPAFAALTRGPQVGPSAGGSRGRAGAWIWHHSIVRAVALLVLIVALLSGCGGSDSSSVAVPVLVGLRESRATQFAEQIGLKPEVMHGRDEDMRTGFVYSQSVREGSMVDEGDTIKLWVSTGP